MASSHIQKHIAKSKRKPDIIATFTSALYRTHGNYKDLGFEDWVCREAKRGKDQALSPQLQWSDIHQSWDLDISRRFIPEFASDKHQNEVEQAHVMGRSARVQPRNGLKRFADEEEHAQRKRARVQSHSNAERQPSSIVDGRGHLLPELRCAYYAAERFSAGWYISHSTAVLLEGKPS